MAQGSEQASWAWADSRICTGCQRKLVLEDTRCFCSQPGRPRAVFCKACWPERWVEWMRG